MNLIKNESGRKQVLVCSLQESLSALDNSIDDVVHRNLNEDKRIAIADEGSRFKIPPQMKVIGESYTTISNINQCVLKVRFNG